MQNWIGGSTSKGTSLFTPYKKMKIIKWFLRLFSEYIFKIIPISEIDDLENGVIR